MTSKLFCLFLLIIAGSEAFDLVREYSGQSFFESWEFYGSFDNLTAGDVNWVNQSTAASENLVAINAAQNAIIRVDNVTNVPFNFKRDTVRITSTDFYDFGSLWVFDVVHLPYGCSVWPAIWTKGPLWPDDGEIDIVEAVNLMSRNQMALHTVPGCRQVTPPGQLGTSGQSTDCSVAAGCTVLDTTPQASYGQAFAQAQGGIWATQFDIAGVFIWFWNRTSIPPNLQSSAPKGSLDITTWGPPVASYPSTACNMSQFFGLQQIVIDITLCGVWAGLPQVYSQTCANEPPNNPSPPNPARTAPACYPDNVPGPGSPRFDEAYFEISYIRAYTTGVSSSTAGPTSTISSSAATTTTSDESGAAFTPNTEIPNSNFPSSAAAGSTDLLSFPLAVFLGLTGIVFGVLVI